MNKQQDLQVLLQKDNFDPKQLSLILDKMFNSLGCCMEFTPNYNPDFNFINM